MPLAVPYFIVVVLPGASAVMLGQVCALPLLVVVPLYVKWFVGVVTLIVPSVTFHL